jgi:hypothetical protein
MSVKYILLREQLLQNDIDYFNGCLAKSEKFSSQFISYVNSWGRLIARDTFERLKMDPKSAKEFLNQQTRKDNLHGAKGKSPFWGSYETWPDHGWPYETNREKVKETFGPYRKRFKALTTIIDAIEKNNFVGNEVRSAIKVLEKPGTLEQLLGWGNLPKSYRNSFEVQAARGMREGKGDAAHVTREGRGEAETPAPLTISELELAPICRALPINIKTPKQNAARSEECNALIEAERIIDRKIWALVVKSENSQWQGTLDSEQENSNSADDISKELYSIQQRYKHIEPLVPGLSDLLKNRFAQKLEFVRTLIERMSGKEIQPAISKMRNLLLQLQWQIYQQNNISQILLHYTNKWKNSIPDYAYYSFELTEHPIKDVIKKIPQTIAERNDLQILNKRRENYLNIISFSHSETKSIDDFNEVFDFMYWHIYTISGKRVKKYLSPNDIKSAQLNLRNAKLEINNQPGLPIHSLLWYSLYRIAAEPSEITGAPEGSVDGGDDGDGGGDSGGGGDSSN